jgi:hypothetical protein
MFGFFIKNILKAATKNNFREGSIRETTQIREQ